jgi:hypothetical protein
VERRDVGVGAPAAAALRHGRADDAGANGVSRRVGAGRFGLTYMVTGLFPHSPLRTVLAPFSAHGSPLVGHT